MNEDQELILKVCLGILQMPQPIHWGYRNWYLPHAEQEPDMHTLVSQGCLIPGMTSEKGFQFFHATRKACLYFGMTEARIEVAMNQDFD